MLPLPGFYGKYWDKYMCISGMFMAKSIEDEYGLAKLKDCLAEGPKSFYLTYRKTKAGKSKDLRLPKTLYKLVKSL